MNKRIISLLFTIILIITSVSLDVSATDVIHHTSGNFKYTILEDGTAEISDYTGADSVVDIPSTLDYFTVSSIGSEAFIYDTHITEVTIPDTVKIIGFEAFCGCSNLSIINIPDSIETVTASSFKYTDYYYDETNWENGVLYLDYLLLFANADITSCTVKPGTRVIASAAFTERHLLESVELPEGLEIIEWLAFHDCIELREITLPSSIKRIGNNAFADCINLADISILSNDLIIEYFAFHNSLYMNDQDNYIDGMLYIDDHLISCQSSTKICNIREGTKTIADSAFSYHGEVEEINIPYGVTRIGEYAFAGCDNVNSIIVPDSVIYLGDGAFYGCWTLRSIKLSKNITEIKYRTFSNCGLLITVDFNGSRISYIGKEAFERCHALIQIELPDSVKIIDDSAFLYCEWLNDIVLPKSLMSIGDQAFDMCYCLESVFYKGSLEERSEIDISYYKNEALLYDAAWHYNSSGHTLETTYIQPSCYAFGYETIACSQCDYKKETSIEPYYEHSWNIENRKGSCTEASEYIKVCKRCGEDKSETYPATGHWSDGGIVTKKATVKQTGVKTYTCLLCEKVIKTKVIPKKISISKAKISINDVTYNGKAQTPTVKVKLGDKSLKKGTAFTISYKNNKNAGKATVTIKGINKYAGTVYKTFKIKPISVSKCKIKLSSDKYSYNGKYIKPKVIIKSPNGNTIASKHYVISGTLKARKVGKYKIVVKLKGNYNGTQTLYYSINPKQVSGIKLSAGDNSVKVSWKKVSKASGYVIRYATNKDFKNAKSLNVKSNKKTIKSLKTKKTYYFKVRAYKKVSGKTYYGAFSSTKKTKTK